MFEKRLKPKLRPLFLIDASACPRESVPPLSNFEHHPSAQARHHGARRLKARPESNPTIESSAPIVRPGVLYHGHQSSHSPHLRKRAQITSLISFLDRKVESTLAFIPTERQLSQFAQVRLLSLQIPET